jgi:hydroxymethylglutaryl-CoA lyase
MMSEVAPLRVFIHEVAPRDGLQIEERFVPTQRKIALIDQLGRTGLAKIEATSFSSAKAIPALADARDVMQGITRAPGVEYAVLVPNARGCERALAQHVDEINVVMSASDAHGRANLRMTPEESLAHLPAMVALARTHAAVNVSISTAFGCPFEGQVPTSRLYDLIGRIAALGVGRITLCDTTGMANPLQVETIFATALTNWPGVRFTAHFHNTRGMGLANAHSALRTGIVHFDASLGGLGGCPFAPGASGNICTEDLVHMFGAMGIETGVDLASLLIIAAELPELVGHDVPGQVLQAGPSTRRYPLPAS